MTLRFYKTLLGVLLVVLTACSKDYDSIEEQDNAGIQEYIQASGLTMQQYGTTGIYYQVVKQGAGARLEYSKRIPAVMSIRSLKNDFVALDTFAAFNRYGDYFGYLAIKGTRVTETIPQLIAAAQINRGGTIRMVVPSRLLFGRNASARIQGYNVEIPGNSSLDITISFADESKQAVYDDLSIQKYIQANKLTGFTKNAAGTYYKINDPGSNTPVLSTSLVTVTYTGKLFNGQTFDSSTTGVSLRLSDVIAGWRETLPLIQKGGSIDLLIPSASGYGITGSADISGVTTIPAFSCLYFTIKVTDVTN